jgi:hypothetical protein
MDELRMQRMLPGQHPEGYYKEHDWGFYDYFLNLEGCEATESQRCVVVGDPRYVGPISAIVEERLLEIQQLAGQEIPKILVFVGDEETMLRRYARIDFTKLKTATFAWGGAQACYINSDLLSKYGISSPGSVRAIMHEPSHSAFNLSIKDPYGSPTWQLDTKDRITAEVLAGPTDPEMWEDVIWDRGFVVDFEPLATGKVTFYDWLNELIEKHQMNEPYFLNPCVAEFYRWASRQGDLAYWYQRALQLKP